jgi:hypothetical protein
VISGQIINKGASMKILTEYMPLDEGETVISSLEGNAYSISSNILSRLFAFVERIISILIGAPRKVHVIVTERRVITIETRKILWFIDSSVQARSYTPRSISQVGYSLSRDLIIFKSHYLEFVSGSLSYLVKSKEGKVKVNEMIGKLTGLAESVTTKK